MTARTAPPLAAHAATRRRRLALTVTVLLVCGVVAGLMAGANGLSPRRFIDDLLGDDAVLLLVLIRAPRTLAAAAAGGLLGLSGALAQGLFRNPLADPYLLGSASGASLGVVAVLAAATLPGCVGLCALLPAAWATSFAAIASTPFGLVPAAFAGALAGVGLTLVIARGAAQTTRLLLAGVVVGVLLGAIADLLTILSPDAMRGRQAFLLGSTAPLGWPAVALLAGALLPLALIARRFARVLDALTLGEDGATSLGVHLPAARLGLVATMCLATALAVSQAGLIAFVGLVAPHLVRRLAPGPHGWLVTASAATGAVLLLAADVIARAAVAPEELPVGVVTAVLGGGYLLVLLRGREAG